MPAAHSGVKVILLGDSNVGKTSLLHRVKEGSFSESAQPTIGCSFCMHTVAHGSQNVGLAIWDTAGQEKYRSFTRQYFRGASAAALVYDTTCGPSLDGARRWLRDVRTELDDIAVVLVGSKSDLTAQSAPPPGARDASDELRCERDTTTRTRCVPHVASASADADACTPRSCAARNAGEVDPAQAASIAAAEGAAHMECSAKDGTNVDAVFEKIVELLLARGLTNSDRALSAPFGGGTVVAQQKRGAVTEVGCCQQ